MLLQPVTTKDARLILKNAGVTAKQMKLVTGFGARRLPGCKPDDTILNKYAAGALSITGVMGVLFGTDSLQHHTGNAKGVRA